MCARFIILAVLIAVGSVVVAQSSLSTPRTFLLMHFSNNFLQIRTAFFVTNRVAVTSLHVSGIDGFFSEKTAPRWPFKGPILVHENLQQPLEVKKGYFKPVTVTNEYTAAGGLPLDIVVILFPSPVVSNDYVFTMRMPNTDDRLTEVVNVAKDCFEEEKIQQEWNDMYISESNPFSFSSIPYFRWRGWGVLGPLRRSPTIGNVKVMAWESKISHFRGCSGGPLLLSEDESVVLGVNAYGTPPNAATRTEVGTLPIQNVIDFLQRKDDL